jgi:hypothetical protein
MQNPIKRQFKLVVPSRSLNLSIEMAAPLVTGKECEITEYDQDTGWEQWLNAVFVQDFEDSVLTAPAPLSMTSEPANEALADMLRPVWPVKSGIQ